MFPLYFAAWSTPPWKPPSPALATGQGHCFIEHLLLQPTLLETTDADQGGLHVVTGLVC